MNKLFSQTSIAICMPLIMAACCEAAGVVEHNTEEYPCVEPAVPVNELHNKLADGFIREAESYQHCIANNVEVHNKAIKEHRRTMTALRVKWKIFADACDDRKIMLSKPKTDGNKPHSMTSEGDKNIVRLRISVN